MKKKYISLAFFISNFLTTFSQSQSLKLWYKQPAVKWTEALPIGNGRLGGMIFGGIDKDHIQFNEETLWTSEPRDYNRPGASNYLPAIRKLLFEGKQKEAEALAQEKFMGMQSGEGKREAWLKEMRPMKGLSSDPSKPDFDEVKGICARGGFVLNISWQNSRLQKVDILSNAGYNCLLRYEGKELKIPTKKGTTYSFNGLLKAIK